MTPLLLTLLAFDHGPWNSALQAGVGPAGVDYAAIGPTGLDPYLASLATASTAGMSQPEKMAFWINAYNALTIDLVAENPGISSIMDLDEGDPWSNRRFTVAGQSVTLNGIEHEILRPMGDPRIHAAVNCASNGCPPLRAEAFTAEGLEAQLDAASRAWVRGNAVRVDKAAGSVTLNQIFDWFGDDFVPRYGGLHDIPGVDGKQEAALNFVAAHADAELAGWLHAGGYTTAFHPYDWSLNAKKK